MTDTYIALNVIVKNYYNQVKAIKVFIYGFIENVAF